MSAVTHSFALMTTRPVDVADISYASSAFTACEITSDFKYTPAHKIDLERKNAAGQRVGRKRDDLHETITFTIAVPEAGLDLVLGGVAVIAVGSGYGVKYNGNWELDQLPETYKAGDKGEIEVTLLRSEYLALVAD